MARISGAWRKTVQAATGFLANAYIKGFLPEGPPIYTGGLKQVCAPGLNCHSCPGALGACPIGSMQNLFDGRTRQFAFYVVGYLALIGLIAGRFVCGWLCLIGLIQELLYRIPVPKLRVPEKPDRILRYLKYAVLAILVFGLPLVYRTQLGAGEPFFCKYVCPAGTLEAGVPLVLLDEMIRSVLGGLFWWKMSLLALLLASAMFIYRPFCKYVCPLGAFYGLFQKVSLIRMRFSERACVGCGRCAGTCKMDVDPRENPNSCECIRCRECIHVCPAKALSMGIGPKAEAGEAIPSGEKGAVTEH